MEIIMNEITLKLSRKAIQEFSLIGEILRKDGKTDIEIIEIFNNHVNSKVLNYYNSKKRHFGIGGLLKKSIIELKGKGVDSKAELVFRNMLNKNKIHYKFQYKIGPYRVDFLISNFLIIEVDGPHHNQKRQKQYDKERDRYIKRLGYSILRLPIWIIAMSERAVVDEINQIINRESSG